MLIGVTMPGLRILWIASHRQAGIPDSALKVSIHKACDGSVAGLNLALNPELPSISGRSTWPRELRGKKVLVGGIEGLSRDHAKRRATTAPCNCLATAQACSGWSRADR